MLMHPALLMIAIALLIVVVPKILRQALMVLGPLATIYAVWNLNYGDMASYPFINGSELVYLNVDRLSWLFALVLCVVAITGNIFALHVKNRGEVVGQFLYIASSLGVVLAGDWLTLIFFWELMAVSSVALIWYNKTEDSRKAGFRYFLVHAFGGNLLLAGIFLKYSQGVHLVGDLTGNMDLASILIMLGVGLNAAIYPLHAWLPDAYSEGTLTGSVFMSSLTTKVAVYVLIRTFPGDFALMWLGVVMAIVGVIYAIMENDIRKLLAYDIVSQVGFMVAGVGLGTQFALNGAAAHAFSHILYKSLLFMGAGAVIYATGYRKLTELGGLYKKMPLVAILFSIGAFSISGFPFLNGFISKSVILSAADLANHPEIELLLYLASVGTFLSTGLRVNYFIFSSKPKREHTVKKLPVNMYIAMIAGASLCILFGVAPNLLYGILPTEMSYIPYSFDHILSTVQLLLGTLLIFVVTAKMLRPRDTILMDLDYFYRKPLVSLVQNFSKLTIKVQESLGVAWLRSVESSQGFFNNPLRGFKQTDSKRPTPDHYNADAYRWPVGTAVIILLSIFIIAFTYVWF